MRTTVPHEVGSCLRGPSVGSGSFAAMGAGVAVVRHKSVDQKPGRPDDSLRNGALPSDKTIALPFVSWPVTTRLTPVTLASQSALISLARTMVLHLSVLVIM